MISEVAKPFAFVLIIVAITSAFAANAGAAINPVCSHIYMFLQKKIELLKFLFC